MYDNKVRLSPDVLEKAQTIAQEWGLKNARAAVEAVFRRYADEYLGGLMGSETAIAGPSPQLRPSPPARSGSPKNCDALDELNDLLGL